MEIATWELLGMDDLFSSELITGDEVVFSILIFWGQCP